MKTEQLIQALNAATEQIRADDEMTSAARKALLRELPRLLQNQAGCATGQDEVAVHRMRVSCRRIRSLLRHLRPYLDEEQVAPMRSGLRELAARLGAVRNYDVFIPIISTYALRDESSYDNWLRIEAKLRQRRARNVRQLQAHIASKRYRKLTRAITAYLKNDSPGRKIRKAQPRQLRHILPLVLHQQLAMVRAYDTIIPTQKVARLHQLRIEFKRLRYLIDFFKGALGVSALSYLRELKRMQDELGALNDIDGARALLLALPPGDECRLRLVQEYLQSLSEKEMALVQEFEPSWRRFQSRRIQRMFSDALMVLR